VWYDGVQSVARRFRVATAILFLGAAKVRTAGDWPLFAAAGLSHRLRWLPAGRRETWEWSPGR
jgi:hypothetical protein